MLNQTNAKEYLCIKSVEGYFTEGVSYLFSFDMQDKEPSYVCEKDDRQNKAYFIGELFFYDHFIRSKAEHAPQTNNMYLDDNDQMRELLVQLTDKLQHTLLKKNLDYGNSYEKTYKKRGNNAIMIRLEDKIERLDQLLTNDKNKKQNVSDESINDTLLDLAGYAILALAVRSK